MKNPSSSAVHDKKKFNQSLAEGYALLSAWADLLDRINVFPVADGDTGANLRISLEPLRGGEQEAAARATCLLARASGNSGNIAAAFFNAFLQIDTSKAGNLATNAQQGYLAARRAVAKPRQGTILDVFETLPLLLEQYPLDETSCPRLLEKLRQTVLNTAETLPELRAAGVIDAGALGMYIFFDGFFHCLSNCVRQNISYCNLFSDKLHLHNSADTLVDSADEYCVEALVEGEEEPIRRSAAQLGKSVVVNAYGSQVKVHIHSTDPHVLRAKLNQLGRVMSWSDEHMAGQNEIFSLSRKTPKPSLHIMTDAAGSLNRELALKEQITLLDSYVLINGTAKPETLCDPSEVYQLMRQGCKVSTAQSSLTERHYLYQSVCEQFGHILYLAVGSAYTGNYRTACAWKEAEDTKNLFEVLDTGAASGRLALIALLSSRFAVTTTNAEAIIARARALMENCREYIFIDTLRYLAAGGRVSKNKSFWGDLLHMKPIITPKAAGVCKVGMVRNQNAQLDFAMQKAAAEIIDATKAVLLLQYSDNKKWIVETVQPHLQALLPEAELLCVPLSLTSGVHMGPGTWSLAFAEEV